MVFSRKLGFVPITTLVQMRRLILLFAVLVCAESYITYRGQKSGQAQRVVHIPVNPNALMFLQSAQRRPLLKRRFLLPRMGMPTYVREGDPTAPAWD
ncbi:hypothetical protein V3C99_016937 [Haemonchus contortus]